jgi:hypothetical protein
MKWISRIIGIICIIYAIYTAFQRNSRAAYFVNSFFDRNKRFIYGFRKGNSEKDRKIFKPFCFAFDSFSFSQGFCYRLKKNI